MTDMKCFTMYRRGDISATHDENTMNPPDEPQYEGVVFADGKVVVHWLTAKSSISVWDSMDAMMAVHGHPEYDSELVWEQSDEELLAALALGRELRESDVRVVFAEMRARLGAEKELRAVREALELDEDDDLVKVAKTIHALVSDEDASNVAGLATTLTTTPNEGTVFYQVHYPDVEEIQESLLRSETHLQQLKDSAKVVRETLLDTGYTTTADAAVRMAAFLHVFGRKGYQVLANWHRQRK